MKIKTKINVTYNTGLNTQKSEKVEGMISTCIQNFDQIDGFSFSYEYKSESGDILENSSFYLKDSEINALYESVKSEVPAGLNYTSTTLYLYCLGMRIEMSETFGIALDQIEIIS